MKKMILLLAVALMTAPAMAAVTITVTDDGDGWARIDYSHDQGANFVRAFALDITADTANIVAIDSLSADYWVYPGSIDINDAGLVDDQGSPVADAGYPGTLGGLDTNGVTIEMGALFADPDPAPAATGVLLRVQVDAACTVCVNGNAIRGNIVMKDATSIDPTEACAAIDFGVPCPWDVDGNGFVNKTDRIAITNYLNVNAAPPFWSVATPPGDENYDVDGNGFINKTDRIVITNYLNVNAAPPFWSVACP